MSLKKGNIKALGYLSFNQYQNREFRSIGISLAPKLEFFFFDHFSLGGSFSYAYRIDSHNPGFSYIELGPSATYYFWTAEKIVAFIGDDIRLSQYGKASNEARLGLDYFIVPSVTLGPALSWYRYFSIQVHYFALGANFGIFL